MDGDSTSEEQKEEKVEEEAEEEEEEEEAKEGLCTVMDNISKKVCMLLYGPYSRHAACRTFVSLDHKPRQRPFGY